LAEWIRCRYIYIYVQAICVFLKGSNPVSGYFFLHIQPVNEKYNTEFVGV
jgi:hypothetical protein